MEREEGEREMVVREGGIERGRDSAGVVEREGRRGRRIAHV